jgi:hypothetical protein
MRIHLIAHWLVISLLAFSYCSYAQQPGNTKPAQKENRGQKSDAKKSKNESDKKDDLPISDLSLQETKSYLHEKLAAYAGAASTVGNVTISYRYNSINFTNNTLKFNVIAKATVNSSFLDSNNAYYPGKSEISGNSEVSFSLSDIDAKSIKSTKLSGGKLYGVLLRTKDNKNRIFVKSTLHGELKLFPRSIRSFPGFQNDKTETSDTCNNLTLVFPDEEIAKSVAAAFAHAVAWTKDGTDPFQPEKKDKK